MCTSPFLVREARLVALSRALRQLTPDKVAISVYRRCAYVLADLTGVTPDEDAEAVRRHGLYWRCMRPPQLTAVRQDFAAAGPRRFPAARSDGDLPPLRLVSA